MKFIKKINNWILYTFVMLLVTSVIQFFIEGIAGYVVAVVGGLIIAGFVIGIINEINDRL